jgi:hypothetical protein
MQTAVTTTQRSPLLSSGHVNVGRPASRRPQLGLRPTQVTGQIAIGSSIENQREEDNRQSYHSPTAFWAGGPNSVRHGKLYPTV